ncbi:MAG: GAF domain-containing protein [Gammaproteobacteria bacterium]|jgi:GAF domain-containing protein
MIWRICNIAREGSILDTLVKSVDTEPASVSPDAPAGECARLATLQGLNILDRAPEERFDRLARLARRLFDVPIALVSLVAENRQWCKSSDGLDALETPRNISLCGHAILGHDVFIVPGATKDLCFAGNPLVVGKPHVRFYAGCPLRAGNGQALGTLCLIDRVPRQFGADDVRSLQDLAAMAEREFAAVTLATIDDLSGISNRRGFSLLAENLLKLSVR